jgi:hypothetical protein
MHEPFWIQTLSVYVPNLAVIASMVRKLWVLALLQRVKLPSTSRVVGREVARVLGVLESLIAFKSSL